jgi:hypothetical protein
MQSNRIYRPTRYLCIRLWLVVRCTPWPLYPIKNPSTSWIGILQPACVLWSLACFLFCYVTVSLSFRSQDTSSSAMQFVVTTDQHFGNKVSFALPSIAVQGTPSDSMFCSRIFLLCTLLKYNYAISLTDIWHSGPYPSQNRDSTWQDISLLKGTSTNCLYLIKCHWYTGSFMPVLHFSSDHELLHKGDFKKRQWRDCIPLPHKQI